MESKSSARTLRSSGLMQPTRPYTFWQGIRSCLYEAFHEEAPIAAQLSHMQRVMLCAGQLICNSAAWSHLSRDACSVEGMCICLGVPLLDPNKAWRQTWTAPWADRLQAQGRMTGVRARSRTHSNELLFWLQRKGATPHSKQAP